MKMKSLLIIALSLLATTPALASMGIDCRNQATGAEFHVFVYADQAPHFSINQELNQAVSRGRLPLQGDGGQLKESQDVIYSVSVHSSYAEVGLELTRQDGGFMFSYAGSTFYFHSNECSMH